MKARVLSIAIDELDATASLDTALSVTKHFGLKLDEARKIAHEVGTAVAQWRKVASGLALSSSEVDRMSSAFEHEDVKKAVSSAR